MRRVLEEMRHRHAELQRELGKRREAVGAAQKALERAQQAYRDADALAVEHAFAVAAVERAVSFDMAQRSSEERLSTARTGGADGAWLGGAGEPASEKEGPL